LCAVSWNPPLGLARNKGNPRPFRNAESAFQALSLWYMVDKFSALHGDEARPQSITAVDGSAQLHRTRHPMHHAAGSHDPGSVRSTTAAIERERWSPGRWRRRRPARRTSTTAEASVQPAVRLDGVRQDHRQLRASPARTSGPSVVIPNWQG